MASSEALMISKPTGKRPCLSLRRTAESLRMKQEGLHQSYVLHVGKNEETDPFCTTADQEYLC